jgi:DNA-binding transcriptional LysR family regulator
MREFELLRLLLPWLMWGFHRAAEQLNLTKSTVSQHRGR